MGARVAVAGASGYAGGGPVRLPAGAPAGGVGAAARARARGGPPAPADPPSRRGPTRGGRGPSLGAGLADPEDVVVVAAAGTSGAGRGRGPHLLASEVMGSVLPYRVGAHQHVPEIKQATGARSLSLTPLLAPMPRGILATVTARPLGDVGRVRDALGYDGEPFVRLLPEGI